MQVPLGKSDRLTPGYVIERTDVFTGDRERVKFVAKRDSSRFRVPGELMTLARWISNYYCAPIGMTLATMLPAAVKRNIGSVRKVMLDLGDPLPPGENFLQNNVNASMRSRPFPLISAR